MPVDSFVRSMTAKTSPSMIRRFKGVTGAHQLMTAVCVQPSVGGDVAIAQCLVDVGSLVDIGMGKVLMHQGGTDNDIYFIISGQVSIAVNGREVARRSSGQHVGEMALLDPTARRSATVTATERTVVLKVAERDITTLANQHPQFWRRLAIELAARLRERSKFLHQPHDQPVVFVGSSSEALEEATCIANSLNRRQVASRLWSQGVFQLSKTTIEDLMRMTTESDFSVLILTPDDMTSSRGHRKSSPRDNAVFELGLFMGSLGRERTFLVTPTGVDLKLPTDLLGLTHLRYKQGPKDTIGKRLAPVSKDIWHCIRQHGSK